MRVSAERATLFGVWLAAAAGCLLGAADPPGTDLDPGAGEELLAIFRALTTTALAITLLLGPGLLWRASSRRPLRLAFLPLPGLALLIVSACLAWVLADHVDPQLICLAILGPILGLMLGALIGFPGDLLDPDEQRVLLLISLALGVAVGKSLWSVGPEGEMYEGTISRTLVPEGRPDSRIPFLVPEMVATGSHPYSAGAELLFSPYNFSSRGPLAGLATTPVVLMSGGNPELTFPEAPWQPFDPQGFMAFRLAMITFSCTVLLSLWELVRRLGGLSAARLALLLGIGTPFFFADLWFTWPKLLGASFVLLAALFVIERRPFRGGLSVGVGYLMHPSALIGLSGIGLLALWPLRRASWKRPQLRAAVLLTLGVGVAILAWRLVNTGHFLQEGFLDYVYMAYPEARAPLDRWLEFRANSLGNTYVPLFLPLFHGHDVSINAMETISPGVVHFFFQYWTSVPFAFAIVFFPMLLASLWRAGRRWPWPVFATLVVPAVAFTIYWGASLSGMLREGMQSWVFAVLAVVALQQAAAGFPWLRSRAARVVLSLRGFEVLALAVGATIGTRQLSLISDRFALVDAFAWAMILACSVGIIVAIWSQSGRIAEAALGGADADALGGLDPQAPGTRREVARDL